MGGNFFASGFFLGMGFACLTISLIIRFLDTPTHEQLIINNTCVIDHFSMGEDNYVGFKIDKNLQNSLNGICILDENGDLIGDYND